MNRRNLKSIGTVIALILMLSIVVEVPLMAATTYTFKDGDTLWDLAMKFFKDPTLFFVFLELNFIKNPRTIPTGTVILVPTMDEMQKIAKEKDANRRKELMNNIRQGTPGARVDAAGATAEGKKPAASSNAAAPVPVKIDAKKASFKNVMNAQFTDENAVKHTNVGKDK